VFLFRHEEKGNAVIRCEAGEERSRSISPKVDLFESDRWI
jgi:hypothetical protein